MVFNSIQQLGKSSIRIDSRWNRVDCYIHRSNTNLTGIFRPKMIKKKKEEISFEEESFLEELFDDFEEDKVYAAS